MVTILEIAEKAGVSPGSVSAVLSGKAKQRRIAPATQQRIEDIAHKLGYQQNALARSLRLGKSGLIGIIGHSYPTYHVSQTRSAALRFIEAGYQIAMQDLAWRPEQEAELLKEVLGLRPEGLFIESGASLTGEPDEAFQILYDQAKRGLPMVRLDTAKGLPVDIVMVDREQGAYLATRHLLQQGHRSIAYAIDADAPSPFIQARLAGFERALREAEIPDTHVHFVPLQLEIMSDWRKQHIAGYRCLGTLLSLSPRPTALLAINDFVAMGAIGAALEAGMRVPGDLAVVGFSGYAEAQFCAVPLTTVAYPFELLAQEAAQLLLDRINGYKGRCRSHKLLPELVVRRSCGAQPAFPSVEHLPEDVEATASSV